MLDLISQSRLPPSHLVIQEVEGEAHGVLQGLHDTEDIVFRSDVHYLAGLETGVDEEAHQPGRCEVKQVPRNIKVKPSVFAYFRFGRAEVRHRNYQHSTRAQEKGYVAQSCRWIVHVLGDVPEQYSVIADAFGDQLVKLLSPNIEIQYVTGMLYSTG